MSPMDPSRPSDFERENLPHQLHRMRQARTVLLAVGSVTVLLGLLIASKPDRQILRAVQTGHGTIRCGECGGTLLIDGAYCCDQLAARRLMDNRLVVAKIPARSGVVLAILTDAGKAALGVAA